MTTAIETRFGNRARSAYPKARGIPTWAAVRRRGLKRKTDRYGIADYLAEGSAGESSLERIVDGAARELGIVFDHAQFTVYLPWGGSTRIDFVIYHPLTAIYVDGIQHELRPEIEWRDKIVRQQLRSMGWRVVAIGWRAIANDPLQAVRRILFPQ